MRGGCTILEHTWQLTLPEDKMNERIKLLAEQATTKISFRLDPNTYKHIDDPEGDLERFEFDKQKFAELIVRECAGIAHGSDQPSRDIKEYFKVK